MSGPYLLRYVDLFVRERSAGAFIFSRNGRSADPGNASGHDVAHGVREGAKDQPDPTFWVAYSTSAQTPFDLERSWHHRYRPTDDPPSARLRAGEQWRCTVAGCATCALAPNTARN